MCNNCGCNVTSGNQHLLKANGKYHITRNGHIAIDVIKSLTNENDRIARHNRQHFNSHHVLAINLMSSPGAGKTSLLESTIEELKGKYNLAVIEGDLETENDAQRIRNRGVTAIQITTGSACHLDAHMIHDALHKLNLADLDIVFIENVGNLVCPASFDLGQHRNVTLLSTTEGDDKPEKYPVMFRASDLMLITKTDLLEVLNDFQISTARQHLQNLATNADLITLSSKTGSGLEDWLEWIEQERNSLLYDEQCNKKLSLNQSATPGIQQTK